MLAWQKENRIESFRSLEDDLVNEREKTKFETRFKFLLSILGVAFPTESLFYLELARELALFKANNMTENREETYYGIKELASILKLNYRTVLDLIVAGDLKAYRIGRVFRISSIQVSRFLKSKEIKNTRSY